MGFSSIIVLLFPTASIAGEANPPGAGAVVQPFDSHVPREESKSGASFQGRTELEVGPDDRHVPRDRHIPRESHIPKEETSNIIPEEDDTEISPDDFPAEKREEDDINPEGAHIDRATPRPKLTPTP